MNSLKMEYIYMSFYVEFYIYYSSKTIYKYIYNLISSPFLTNGGILKNCSAAFFTQQYILDIFPISMLRMTSFFLQLHCIPWYRCTLLERSFKHLHVRGAPPSPFLPHLCIKTCPPNTDLL